MITRKKIKELLEFFDEAVPKVDTPDKFWICEHCKYIVRRGVYCQCHNDE